MTREEFIKQRCGIDKITEEEFEKRYRVVKCNCGQPYCKGYRCLDLDDLLEENQELKKKYENAVADYETAMAEKEQLKKQLEEANEKIILLQASEPMLNYKKALEENQQKEFIEYLENEININPYNISDYAYEDIINTILSKYKEIIGSDSDD